jgi:methionyl aminopeptidase
MSNIYTDPEDLKKIREATKISTEILLELKDFTVEGVSAVDLERRADELIKKHKVISSFKGVPGLYSDYPSNICVMTNHEAVHAIPGSEDPFEDGDIIKIDMGIIYKGIYTDHGLTVGIGNISAEHQRMIETVELSVNQAVKEAKDGAYTGDISYVLGSISELAGFDVVTSYAGHGIGPFIHTDPSIPFKGEKGEGELLQEGMLLSVENWITDGDATLTVDADGWTDYTVDGSTSAFYELMILVGKRGPEILTKI